MVGRAYLGWDFCALCAQNDFYVGTPTFLNLTPRYQLIGVHHENLQPKMRCGSINTINVKLYYSKCPNVFSLDSFAATTH